MSEAAKTLPTIEQVAAQIVGAAAASPAAESAPVEAAAVEGATAAGGGDEGEAVANPEPKDTPKAEEPKKDGYSSKFAALSRKERDIKQRERQLAEQTKAMREEIDQLKSVKDVLGGLKKNPAKALKELGVSYQDITNDVIGNYKEPEPDPVQAKIDAVKKEITEAHQAELGKMRAELRQKEVDQAEMALRSNLTSTIEDNPEKYELCAAMGTEAIELGRQIIQIYYEQHGRVLNYDEVLDMTERHFQEDVLKKLLSAKKAKEMAGYKPPPATPPKATPTKGPSATLTNAQRGRQDTVNIDKMGKEEALQYLINKHLKK